METGDCITLANGEKARIISGDVTVYKNALVVELENKDVRVVDRESLHLAKANPHDNLGNHKRIREL